MLQPTTGSRTADSARAFAHTHLVRGGLLMLRPSRHAVLIRAIAHRRLKHHGPTSHEVGMPATTLSCRPEHHGPTSHEVGMRENLTRTHSIQNVL
jgi:hypothetical protein